MYLSKKFVIFQTSIAYPVQGCRQEPYARHQRVHSRGHPGWDAARLHGKHRHTHTLLRG